MNEEFSSEKANIFERLFTSEDEIRKIRCQIKKNLRLKAIRAGNRGVITKKINDVGEILAEVESDGIINEKQAKRLDILNCYIARGKGNP